MTITTLQNNVTLGEQRAKINANFAELDTRTANAASDAADVAAGLAAHASAADPHPQYLTQAEGDGRYLAQGTQTATNLTATASPTGVTVVSDTGTDAELPLSDGTNAGLMSPAQHGKLAGVAAGATANATDAQLRDRSTHTGTQAISTVTGLQAALDSKQPAGAYATAAQGAKADTALQDLAGWNSKFAAAPAADQAQAQYLVSGGLLQTAGRRANQQDANLSRSAGLALVAKMENTPITELWADLSGWTGNTANLQVSGGRLYPANTSGGAASGIVKALSLGVSENVRVVTSVTIGTFDNIGIGFTSGTAGATPPNGATDAFGIYLPFTGGVPKQMSNGTTTDIGTSTINAGETYVVTAAVTPEFIDVVMTKSDGTREFRTRRARSGFTVNNFWLFISGTGGLSNGSIGPWYAAKQYASLPRVSGIEAQAPFATGHWLGDGTNDCMIWMPKTYSAYSPCPVVIMCHPYGSTGYQYYGDNANGYAIRNALLNAGFAVIAGTYNSNSQTWGAQPSLTAYQLAFKRARDMFALGPVCLYGNSMGGFESLLLLARGVIPGVVAWAGTVPGTNLAAAYADTTNGFGAAITTAYGISGDYATKTDGYDVMLRSPLDFGGVPMWLAYATDDTTLPPTDHMLPFISKMTAAGNTPTVITMTGGHSTTQIQSQASAIVTHFQNALGI